MTMTMTMNQILTVLIDVVSAEKAVEAAQAKVTAAKIELTKTYTAMARGGVRDAENDLREQEERLGELLAQIPPSEEVPMAWTLRFCAEQLVMRSALERKLDRTDEKISELEAIKTFRSKKAGVSPEMASVMKLRDELREQIHAINVGLVEWRAVVDDYDRTHAEMAESEAWMAAGFKGPAPTYIQGMETAYEAMLNKVLVPLPRIKRTISPT